MPDRSPGTLRVRASGLLTTVQDLGRPGWASAGIAPGGALDRGALILGNRLLANEPGEAGLEITLLGPELEFSAAAVIALTGADLGAQLHGQPMPRWQPVVVQAGDRLSFDPAAPQRGARAYLCVAGGFDLAPVLGSRSTDLAGGFGGLAGRPLKAGDILPLRGTGRSSDNLLHRRLAALPPAIEPEFTARVVLGPQAEWFTASGIETFLSQSFTVSARSDRMGVRLNGPAIAHARAPDLLSEGIAHGAIQVPGDGQPIVLLASRQTIGGYPKIATVIGADLDRFGQLRPGNGVRFTAVSVAEARTATLAHLASLDESAIIIKSRQTDESWDLPEIIRLIEGIVARDMAWCRLEIGSSLKLEVHRNRGAVPENND